MKELVGAKWIKTKIPKTDIAPIYFKEFDLSKKVISAKLLITVCGVYIARLNGKRVGDFVLAPGWTPYEKRMQYQAYDITDMLSDHNELTVTVGKGWHHSRLPAGDEWNSPYTNMLRTRPYGIIARIDIEYADGNKTSIGTDTSWTSGESMVRFTDNYDGETVDASFIEKATTGVEVFDAPTDALVLQEGESIIEQERISTGKLFVTPNGETLIDFGQNIAGYVETILDAKEGEILQISCGEVLDAEGNLYNENFRSAKALYTYICRDGKQISKPGYTYYGFRYIRIDKYPGGIDKADPKNFTAIVVGSHLRRTGYFDCSNDDINRIYKNILWTQRSNAMDVSTDCPQRDERHGWIGDAKNFIETGCRNYDVNKFFTKWLHDMVLAQRENGGIPVTVPDVYCRSYCSCCNAITDIPMALYRTYGNIEILRDTFPAMLRWIDFQNTVGAETFGDWLGLDSEQGSYEGATRKDFLIAANFIVSVNITIETGEILGEDVSQVKELRDKLLAEFRTKYPEYLTQTECVFASYFDLAENPQKVSDQLADMIRRNNGALTTGLAGVTYLFRALSKFGHGDVAYDLLFREKFPSWIYQVRNGATTVWEHWDSILEDGSFWSSDMNSFNHLNLGAIGEWFYTYVAGIVRLNDAPAYSRVKIEPHPDKRLTWARASIDTKNGVISSGWYLQDGVYRYEITTPVAAELIIDGVHRNLDPGDYVFYGIEDNKRGSENG